MAKGLPVSTVELGADGLSRGYGSAGDSEPFDMIRALDGSLPLLDTSSVGGTTVMCMSLTDSRLAKGKPLQQPAAPAAS